MHNTTSVINKCFFLIFCITAIFLSTVLHANSEIYMRVDEDGVLHFTNVPTSPGYRIYLRDTLSKPETLQSADRFDHVISDASKRHGISFSLLKALIKVESNFNPRAVSGKGALGLMQIMPINFKELRISDPFDPWENIMGGTHYLKKLLERFDGKMRLALAAYNAGPGKVARYKEVPPIKETKDFVKKVMMHYYRFQES